MNGKAIGIFLIAIVTVPAAYMLFTQLSSGEKVQVDFTLKLQSSAGDKEYKAKYHWGANEIDSTMTTSNVKWSSLDALAQVLSSGDLTDAVKGIFSTVSITTDDFSVNTQGYWTLSLKKKLCDGIYVNLEADGDNASIQHMTPSLTVSAVPSSLSSALQGIGLDSLNVIVTIRLHIMGEVVQMFLWNCYEVLMGYASLLKEVVDWAIGTVYVP